MPYEAFIRRLAETSGEAILSHYGKQHLATELKADESPVTIADREAEGVMRSLIEKNFPDHGIIGEEYGTVRGESEYVWVLDPIDGTKSFISAVPLFGTLIGLLHQGKPVLGCIHQPVLRQLMIGNGKQTTLNGEPVHVRRCPSLTNATLLTTDPLNPARHQNGPAYDALCNQVRLVRTWGDCYGYLLLAAGWADIMLDPVMKPWDFLPLVPVVEGAGGRISDWKGNPASTQRAESTIACVPELHDAVVRALNPG
jgi:myo-inositol-1(or 4)-monophosphatase